MPDSSWTLAHIADHHLGTRRSYRYRPAMTRRWEAIKRQIIASGAELLFVGGDLTRDGDTHQFEYQNARADLDTLPIPSFVIPGNMGVGNKHTRIEGCRTERGDLALNMTFHRLALFAGWFGPINWTFMHRGVRFSGFYAAIAGSGLPEEARFWRFLEDLTELPPARPIRGCSARASSPAHNSDTRPGGVIDREDLRHYRREVRGTGPAKNGEYSVRGSRAPVARTAPGIV